MALDVLQWTKESREDVNFVLEGKLLFTPSTEANWKRVWTVKMAPVSALLVTLGQNSMDPPSSLRDEGLQFPIDTGVREAALLLIREKNNRYSMIRVSNILLLLLAWSSITINKEVFAILKYIFVNISGANISRQMCNLLGTRLGGLF